MNLEQFNVDLESNLKKKVRVECVEMEVTHGVMMTAIVEDFFRRHRSKAARKKIIARLKAKMEKGGEVHLPSEPATIHHVELAEAAHQ